MENLPQYPQDVKHLLTPYDPYTGNYVVFPETDRGIVNIPIEVERLEPSRLLYTLDDLDIPELVAHGAGFAYVPLDPPLISLPHKDIHGFPLFKSKPADFKVILCDLAPGHSIPYLREPETVIIFTRDTLPGEVTPSHISALHATAYMKQRSEQPTHEEPAAEPAPGKPRPQLHLVKPAEPLDKPPSDQLLLALYQIPTRLLAWPLSLGLPFGACVCYLLLHWFHVPTESHHTGLYSDLGINQLTRYLSTYKPILVKNAPDHWRDQAKRMGTSIARVKDHLPKLRDCALAIPVSPPRQGVRTSRRLISRNEKERRENLPLARKVKANPRRPHVALRD